MKKLLSIGLFFFLSSLSWASIGLSEEQEKPMNLLIGEDPNELRTRPGNNQLEGGFQDHSTLNSDHGIWESTNLPSEIDQRAKNNGGLK